MFPELRKITVLPDAWILMPEIRGVPNRNEFCKGLYVACLY